MEQTITTREFTTSKGTTFTTDLSDAAAYRIVEKLNNSFASSLMSRSWDRLSESQRIWVHKLAADATYTTPRPELPVGDLQNLHTMVATASASLKYPKIRLAGTNEYGERVEIALKPRGDVIYVEDLLAKQFDQFRGEYRNVYHGKIERGSLIPPRGGCPDWVLALIRRFAADPLGEAQSYGRLTGSCCFCGRSLTDPTSVERGYGPICAEKYGLS